MSVCVHDVYVCCVYIFAVPCEQMSEDNFVEFVLFFFHVVPQIKFRFSGMYSSAFTQKGILQAPFLDFGNYFHIKIESFT